MRYCPCGDPAGSTAASNIAPGGGPPLLVTQSKYGAGGAVQAFGTQPPNPLLGDVSTLNPGTSGRTSTGGSMWRQTIPTASFSLSQGYALAVQSGSFPPVSGGVTIEFWFQATPAASGGFITSYPQALMTMANSGGDIMQIGLQLATSATNPGALIMGPSIDVSTGPFTPVVISSVNYQTGTPPMTQVVLAFNRTTYTAYVNGQEALTGSWSPWNIPPVFTELSFGGDTRSFPPPALAITGPVFFAYSGFLGHIAVFPGLVPAGRILSHYYAGFGYAGETASRRVERLLEAAGLTGRRHILPDTSFQGLIPVASCQDIAQQPASAALTNIAASTTPAVLSVAPTGAISYLPVQDAYNQPVIWTLGDNQAAGEIPFLPDYAPDYDPVRVVNDIAITQLDDQTVNVPSYSAEAASVTQYGDQSYQATGYLQGDVLSSLEAPAGLGELANWIAAVKAKPRMRVAAVTVQAAANVASQQAWAFFGGAAVGDIVQINLRPPTAGGELFAVLGRITQTKRERSFSQEKTTAVITCTLDSCPEESILTADDPVRGQLNGLNPLGY